MSGQIVPLFHPRQQVWAQHFARQGAAIVGLTPTGRTTVAVMDMNSPERLRLRSQLG